MVKTDCTQKLLTVGKGAELHVDLCPGDPAFYRENKGKGLRGSAESEKWKNPGLATVKAIRLAVPASWQSSKAGLCPPRECGTQSSCPLNVTFQSNGPQVLDREASEWQEIHIHNCKPFLVGVLKGGAQGTVIGVSRANSKFSCSVWSFSGRDFNGRRGVVSS